MNMFILQQTDRVREQLEDKIVEMIDNHINPAMTKGKLIKTINEKKSESFILRNPKKVTMFSDEEGIESKGRRKRYSYWI